MPAHDQRLDGKYKGLDAQQHGMHDPHGVYGVEREALEGTGIFDAIWSWLLV
ncbi:hypothetical protein ACMYR2_3001 [Nitrobacter sp. TKz-YC01]